MPDDRQREQQIREALRRSDSVALELIYDEYGNGLFGYLLSLTSSEHDAEELLSELFALIVRKRRQLAGADRLKTYLFSMTRNLFNEWYRTKKHEAERNDDYALYLETAEGAANQYESEDLETLKAAFGKLPGDQRDVVMLKTYEDLTFAEIAETLGISPNTAASRYRYGLEKLRQLLETDNHE